MKWIKCTISLLLALTCLISLLAVVSSGAAASGTQSSAENEPRFTKKIVSVLFDNSGSMSAGDKRNSYATYSIQMLMALLSEKDELIITPMNVNGSEIGESTYKSASVAVDLTAADRDAEIRRVMSSSFLANRPLGGTPSRSISYAVKNLTDRGLMDSQNLAASAENTEHWLVILTDGEFNNSDGASADALVEKNISNYPSLKTVFIAFGPQAPDLSSSSLTQKYPFTAYRAPDSASAVNTMQSVANQLSGRYVLSDDKFEVNGNQVVVDIGLLDFSLKSISVVAQNCGATLESATYNGTAMSLAQACVITPSSELSSVMKNGYSAVVNGSPFFSGGKLTLEFSTPVAKENLSIMAEPALRIQAYVERLDGSSWVRTDEQYINANLIQGDKLRVGYEVYEQATGKLLDINSIFSDVATSVSYAKSSYLMGQEIPLVTGNNEIAVEVSVMNGAYKMYSTIRCIIETNPTDYRVTATTSEKISYYTKKATASYVVYAGGVPLDRAGLSAFSYTVEVTAPDGTITSPATTVAGNGEIKVDIPATDTVFGTYTVKFKVYNEYHISREHIHTLEYKEPTVTIVSSGTDRLESPNTRAQVAFEVQADGSKLTKQELGYFNLTLSVCQPGGQPTAVSPTISADGTISYAFNVEQYGKALAILSVTDGKTLSTSAEHAVGYYPKTFEIKGEHIDRLPAKETKTDLAYTCYIDGKLMTKDELDKYAWTLMATQFDGTVFAIPATIDAGGKVTATLDLTGKLFGVYDVKFEVAFSDEYVKSYDHAISYYPESLTLTSGGGLSLSEHELIENQNGIFFEMLLDGQPSSFLNKIVQYKLTVNGVDVTAYAVAEGNKLVYAPRADHLGTLAAVGEKTVTLQIICQEVPALSTSQSVTLTVTSTLYEVVPITHGNKTVDRFRLSETDAAVYFKVLRDGVPLSAAELEEALAAGTLTLKDKKGVFTWQFWSPAGKRITVEEIDGTPAVVYHAVCDIPVVDSFLAMLIFNGDKTVQASYDGVSATDAIHFAPSAAWSYIWRILVILWIIHTIFYIVGFFNGKCKRLPKGTVVTINVTGGDGKELKPTVRAINATFLDRNGWHVVRYFKSLLFFLPKQKYWYHQPSSTASNITVMRSEKGKELLVFGDKNVYPVRNQGGTDSATALSAFRGKLKRYKGEPPAKFESPVLAGEIRDMMIQNADNGAIPKDTPVPVSGMFGKFTKEKLTKLIFFEKNVMR
ncbi:MAG: hypothetical protein E7644_03585 [Ruminococcaceae bacterium]|nr:hypothetical protein [Oscillospiraceae bacterium]